MKNLFQDNPFARQHLKDISLLSGEDHKNKFEDITRLLNLSKNKSNCKSVLIHGDRGTGKSSLIKLIELKASDYNCISVPYFLSDVNEDRTIEFFFEIYSLLFKQCKANDVLVDEIRTTEMAIALGELPKDGRKWVFNFMQKYLEYKIHSDRPVNLMAEDIASDLVQILGQFRREEKFGHHSKITFIIDEAQRIFGNSKILNIIRHLIQEEIGVTFILASQIIHDDTVIRHVFDRLERAFNVFELKHFSSEEDIREYITKSLYSINWKERDLRLNIKNIDKLVTGIYHLTNGKPEFVNGILESMFHRVQKGLDKKLRLNDSILYEIADQIEASSPESIEDFNSGFNLSRAQYIISLKGDRLKWYRYLSKSLLRSTPNKVYDFMNPFTFEEISSKEGFHRFVQELFDKEIFLSVNREKRESESLGYKFSRNKSKSKFDTPFMYTGNHSENVWTNLMIGLSTSSIQYKWQHPAQSFTEEIMVMSGFHGKRGVNFLSRASDRFILNGSGTWHGEIEEWDVPGFLVGLKNGNINIEEFGIELVRFLFELFKSSKSNAYVCAVNIRFNENSVSKISYQDAPYKEAVLLKLKKVSERFNDESRKMTYQLAMIEKSSLLAPDEFSKLIRESNNTEAKRVIYHETVNPAIELYLDDSKENKNEILNWINCVYEGLISGDDIPKYNLNNAAYMFLNLGERAKALKCLEQVYDELKKSDFDDAELDESTIALCVYNYALLNALFANNKLAIDLFEEAILIGENISKWDLKALNLLSENLINGEYHLKESQSTEDIDLIEFANSNIKVIKENLG